MPDISAIHHIMVGVSFLKDEESQVLKQEWDSRFQSNLAFWIDAAPGDTAQSIAIKLVNAYGNEGFFDLAGQSIVLALFYDLREPVPEEVLSQVKRISAMIHAVTGGHTASTVQYGYLGQVPFVDGGKLRSNIAGVSANQLNRLTLVAMPPLVREGTSCWKASIVMLDLMRRTPAPDTILPLSGAASVDAVGFLRYGEFNQSRLNKLTARKEELDKALGDTGREELRNLLLEDLRCLETAVEREIVFDSTIQPIHPDMNVYAHTSAVERFTRRARLRSQYESAVQSTVQAVQDTGKRMEEAIMDKFHLEPEEAAARLMELLHESGAGISLVESIRDLTDDLNLKVDRVNVPSGITFPPNGADYKNDTKTIDLFLRESRRWGIYQGECKRLEQMKAAFADVQKEYLLRKKAMEEELQRVKTELKTIRSREQFVEDAIGNGTRMQTCFYPIHGEGETGKYILCRESQDAVLLSQRCAHMAYQINAVNGSLKKIDGAQMKSLHVLYFHPTPSVLENLVM